MPARVAINGLGRIGRATLKAVMGEPALELVAVNDVAPTDNLAYLLRYDTVYGRLDQDVTSEDATLSIGDRSVRVLNEQDPSALARQRCRQHAMEAVAAIVGVKLHRPRVVGDGDE